MYSGSNFFLNEKLSIFSTFFNQPEIFLANLTPSFPILPSGPDLSPDIFSLPRKSRPPGGPWGKGEGLWGWVRDRQRDLLHQWWKTSDSHQNNLSIYKLMDGTSLKANCYLAIQMFFVCELSQMGWCKEATLVAAARGAQTLPAKAAHWFP